MSWLLPFASHFPAHSSAVRAQAYAHSSYAIWPWWAMLGISLALVHVFATAMLEAGIQALTPLQATFFTNLRLSGLHS